MLMAAVLAATVRAAPGEARVPTRLRRAVRRGLATDPSARHRVDGGAADGARAESLPRPRRRWGIAALGRRRSTTAALWLGRWSARTIRRGAARRTVADEAAALWGEGPRAAVAAGVRGDRAGVRAATPSIARARLHRRARGRVERGCGAGPASWTRRTGAHGGRSPAGPLSRAAATRAGGVDRGADAGRTRRWWRRRWRRRTQLPTQACSDCRRSPGLEGGAMSAGGGRGDGAGAAGPRAGAGAGGAARARADAGGGGARPGATAGRSPARGGVVAAAGTAVRVHGGRGAGGGQLRWRRTSRRRRGGTSGCGPRRRCTSCT
jgi:hypothetical protein